MQVWQEPAENKYLWALRSGQTQTRSQPKARFCSQVLHFQSQVLLVRAADRVSPTTL